jgi:predicted dehydrogenase
VSSLAHAEPLVRRPRLGFVGLGWIGRHRMEAVAASGAAEIAAIADTAGPLLEAAVELAPEAARATTLDELLSHELDGVVIATPSALHAEHSIAALERGFAVFCQKPLGRDAAETAAVVGAARRAGRLLGVDLSYRFTAAVRAIRELISSGAIGEVRAADLTFHNAYGPDKPWFYDRALSGGGCLIDLGVHLVDLALWMLDFPPVESARARLHAGAREWDPAGSEVEDYAVGEMVLEGGRTIRVACSWNLPSGCDAVIDATFYGTVASAAFRNVDGSFYDFTAEILRKNGRETIASPPDAWGGRAAVAWAQALGRDGRFDPEIERTVTVARVLDSMYGRDPDGTETT